MAGRKMAARKKRTSRPANHRSMSISRAIKRLPTPARGISMVTSSGVSMLSWSDNWFMAIGSWQLVHGTGFMGLDSQDWVLRTVSMAHILSNLWLGRRRPHWERLGVLLGQADSTGLNQLSPAELQGLALLYRPVAAHPFVLRQAAARPARSPHLD